MRGLAAWAAAAVGLLGAARPAGADELSSTFSQPLAETLHTVDIGLSDGVAVETIRRTFHNDGDGPEELLLTVAVPSGAALTGLRVKSGDHWVASKLLSAEAAKARYEELIAPGEGRPRLFALLEWSAEGQADLHLFPVGAKKTVTVEYTLVAPAHVMNGRIWLEVPRPSGDGLVQPVVRIEPADASDARAALADEIPSFDVDDGAGVDSDSIWYTALAPALVPAEGEARARYAAVSLASGRHAWRLDVDAPTVWGEPPRGARVVFVLDASYSEARAGIDAQLDLVRGYLADLPDATAEIVLFRRRATRVFGDFVPAAELDAAMTELPATAFLPGNGSNVEEGLAVATRALAGWDGEARIVVMSDQLFRESFDAQAGIQALSPLPQGVVVNGVVRVASGGAMAEAWVNDGTLVDIARSHGGTVLEIDGDSQDLPSLAAVTRGLVVPIRIDGFRVDWGSEDDTEGAVWPEALVAGAGVSRMAVWDGAPLEKVTLRGWLWGKEWTRELAVDAPLAARMPALIIGSPIEGELTDAEGAPLATAAGVVSRWTSYLAEDKGAEPSSDGFERGDLWGSGAGISCGTISCCCGGCGIGTSDSTDYAAILRARIEPAVAACAQRAGRAHLNVDMVVEATRDEIVDVRLEQTLPPPLAACIVDAGWGARLDGRFRREHASYGVPMVIGDGDDAPAEPPAVKDMVLL